MDASTVFANVGVDYFGPFTVKIGRRTENRWRCLFTCLRVRAVHIEIVPKMDTDSYLNAVMRFIAQKGKPMKMISDNGKNFVGAYREFKEYVAAWRKRNNLRIIGSTRDQIEVQSTRSTPLWRSAGATSQKLQESNVNSVGEPINY